jgi:AcrR family transcriptional regulator
MTARSGPAPTGTRRDQLRQATVAEIKATARRLLVEDAETLSLRAIARSMGMSAPALYRYYDSYEGLVTAVTVDLFNELVEVLEDARDALPEDDVPARLFAVSRAFRTWSLDHPREFALLFANPMPHLAGPAMPPEASQAAHRFGFVFGELVSALWRRQPFPDARDEALDPRLAAQLGEAGDVLPGRLPRSAQYLFLRCWSRLYGTVTLEVFGHLRWALSDTEPLFEDMLADNARSLGVLDDYRRLMPHRSRGVTD